MYDAATGRFTVLHSTLRAPLRAWSERRDTDGAFWLFDASGNVYRFHPDRDRIEERGLDWGANGWYVASLAGDPSAAHGYQTTKVYGVALRQDGGSLILVANGNAAGEGRMPAVFGVRIPASER
jgi:hypothetical protein